MASSARATMGPRIGVTPIPPKQKAPVHAPDVLLRYNLMAGFSHLLTFVMMATFFGGFRQFRLFSFDVFLSGRSTDETTFVTLPLFEAIGPFNVVVVIAAFPLITAIFHFLEAAWGREIAVMIRDGAHWLRWVEYSISAPSMLISLAVMSGVLSVGELTGVFGNYFACMILGGAAEWFLVAERNGAAAALGLTVASFLAFFAAWISVAVSFFYSIANAPADVSTALGFVYVAFSMLFASNMLFPAIFLWKMARVMSARAASKGGSVLEHMTQHGPTYEKAYVILSFASKMGLAWNIFGAAFQVKHPDSVAEVDPGYSQWLLMVVLMAGVVWAVAASAAYLFNGWSLDYLQGQLATKAPDTVQRLYTPMLLLAVGAEITTFVLAMIDISDYTEYGWAAAMVLAIHIACEAVYFPAAQRALETPALNKYVRAVLWLAFASYATFAGLCIAYASSAAYRTAFAVLGGYVSFYLLVFDATLYPMYALRQR